MDAITMVVRKGSACGGSGPVLIVGCCVVIGVGEGRRFLKSATSKSVIGLTNG
jgi:hypothetical protein